MTGQVIKKLLSESAELMELIPIDRIFPYVINEGTPLPAMVYTIDTINPEYTKDGWANDTISFSLIIFSENYATLQQMITLSRLALDFKFGDIGITEEDTIKIGHIYFNSQSEGYSLAEDAFLSRLSFTVNTYNY